MTQSSDIIFITEYIKNVFYFATVRQGKELIATPEIDYFCIDDILVYENYYSDFGPLNLGCVYKYCILLHDKLSRFTNKQSIVHYTSIDPRKKANSAFLVGCYGVLYLNLSPKEALKPLITHAQTYRPFQDATQGKSIYTITIIDCLQAIKKARGLGFFSFQDFNYEEYNRLDKVRGGDLNWIVPGKFLAFTGPVDYNLSLFHPPEMYIDYFRENNVKMVIRLNKRSYDGSVFTTAGIMHYDLFFPDGSCPPRHILMKFLQISEDGDGAIAVHCKAGLGRTGSLIGSYLIKHYRMSAHEAIGWMRICRPGSVIGHQQEWLEQIETWLIKQGNLYRKRNFEDTEKLPTHEFGIYSITERAMRLKPLMLRQLPSPPQMHRQTRSETTAPVIEQSSRLQALNKVPEKEYSDWRVKASRQTSNLKCLSKPDPRERTATGTLRRVNGAGEPRLMSHSPTRNASINVAQQRTKDKFNNNISQKNSIFNHDRESQLMSSIKVTPHYQSYQPNCTIENVISGTKRNNLVSSPFNTDYRGSTQTQQRRRLGRSPSPSPCTSPVRTKDHTRATNTPASSYYYENSSKSALREALSRLKLTMPRDGSVGAASVGAGSLGARREAPLAKRAPSVRSDERPLATQGDMLNSIKFQRRFRESLNAGKMSTILNDNPNATSIQREKNVKPKVVPEPRPSFHKNYNYLSPKEKPSVFAREQNAKASTGYRLGFVQDCSSRQIDAPKSRVNQNGFGAARPASPKPSSRQSRNFSPTRYY